jgi:hypothetical protein
MKMRMTTILIQYSTTTTTTNNNNNINNKKLEETKRFKYLGLYPKADIYRLYVKRIEGRGLLQTEAT